MLAKYLNHNKRTTVNSVKLSQVSSCIRWFNGEWTNLLRTIPALVMRELKQVRNGS